MIHQNQDKNLLLVSEQARLEQILKTSNAYQLRPYQESLKKQIIDSFGAGTRKVMAQAPTGSGKTVTLSSLAKEFCQQGKGVMLVAHKKELILQGKEKLEQITGLPVSAIKAGMPFNPEADIFVASIQTLASRKKLRPEVGLVIIDEAHHCAAKSYRDLFEDYPEAYFAGFTATPCRIDGQGFKGLFESLVKSEPVSWFIENGYLCRYRYFSPVEKVNTKGIRKNRGDFSQAELAEAAIKISGAVVPTWQKYAEGKQTIVFCVDISHSNEICDRYKAAGIAAEHIDGDLPDRDRDAIIDRFRRKETMILTNCNLVSEGFDVPGIEVVQLLRPTASLSMFLQQVGRALRPAPGKDYAIIIDHTENVARHGLPDDDIEWSLDIVKSEQQFCHTCTICAHVFKPLHHELTKPVRSLYMPNGKIVAMYQATCPNCGYTYEFTKGTGGGAPPRVIERNELAEMLELSIEVNQDHIDFLQNLLARQEEFALKKGWVYYRLLEHPNIRGFSLGDWRVIAQRLGYKQGWAYLKFKEIKQENHP